MLTDGGEGSVQALAKRVEDRLYVRVRVGRLAFEVCVSLSRHTCRGRERERDHD